MFENDPNAQEDQTNPQYILEESKTTGKKIKQTTKYIVFKSWRSSQQGEKPATDESSDESLELISSGTVFDNVYYPHLLLQRKYIID